jgi:RND family efflux transporter MFP subunit
VLDFVATGHLFSRITEAQRVLASLCEEELQQSMSSWFVRWGPRLGLLLLLTAFCSCAGSKGKGKAAQKTLTVPVVRVVRKNLTSTLRIASEFQPYQEIGVYAKVSGYIEKLNINWGTRVRQGQVMAVLEIPELQEQVRYDEASLRRSENELTRAQQEESRLESDYQVAHVTYTRLSGVWNSMPGLISREDLDVAHGKDSAASASVSAAKAALSAAEETLAAAKATLQKDRAMYAYSRIIAPFDGVVTSLNAFTGALLPGGTTSSEGDLSLCHLSQNNLLRLVIPVPERNVPDIHIGDALAVDVSTLARTFKGKVARFSDQIDVSTRTMHTEIDVPNPKYVLVPGMYASVELPVHTVQHALAVPVQAVQSSSENTGRITVVTPGNVLERRNVTLGVKTPTDVEIVNGVQENEMVVFGEQSQYQAGEHVTPHIVQPPQSE